MKQKIRNIAIIAHVDHGKTTLVDAMLYQSKLFKEHEEKKELILDSNELERERGITIVSKNVAVRFKDFKINIIDTPGHADFGGEVERVLKMADGVLLLVDAFEGPMPQTRFVLKKALELNLKPIVVINKVDKPNCRPDEVHEMVFDLFYKLDASEEQLSFPVVYGSSLQGWMTNDLAVKKNSVEDLLETIIDYVPEPKAKEGTLQIQITSLDYSSYTGRIAIGKVLRGNLAENQAVSVIDRNGNIKKSRVKELFIFEGLGRVRESEVSAGEIVAINGLEGFEIGDTIADFESPEALPPIHIDEPTMSMLFTINNSPFFGKDGKFVTSRHIRDRLLKETEKNLALKVEETDSPDNFIVHGRGILHLSILIETMRREGYELQVGQPKVIIKEIDGVKHEPIEVLTIDLPESFSGKAIEIVTKRKGDLINMTTKDEYTHLEFSIPSRSLMGLRNQMLSSTAGEAVIAHRFEQYEPLKGDVPGRLNGVLVSMETGTTTAYSIDKLQDRGKFFVDPGEDIYEGQILGEHIRNTDLVINIIKGKKLTNVRASGSDDNVKIAPKIKMSLEECLEYIAGDEYVEVTPKAIRMRKIKLKENERKRA
ncbi:MAG: translational GTPase TypA [Chitinophagaceae bacterium]|nr:MAG: translational GTPase TypA [Chitinophagaceae bacterium]